MDSGSCSETEHEEGSFKIVLIGNECAGKTTLIQSFCRGFHNINRAGRRSHGATASSPVTTRLPNCGSFDETGAWRGQYKPTVGVEFYSKRITLPSSVRNGNNRSSSNSHSSSTDDTVLLHLWDVGGQQARSPMLDSYLHDADAVCLVYDVTDASSFAAVEQWYGKLQLDLGKCRFASTYSADAGGLVDEGMSTSGRSGTPLDISTATPPTRSPNVSINATNAPVSTGGDVNDRLAGILSSVIHSATRAPRLASSQRGHDGQPVVALVGTKTDAAINTHAVSRSAHDRLVAQYGFDGSFCVSARTGDRVSALFLKVTADLLGHEVSQADLEDFGFATTMTIEGSPGEYSVPSLQQWPTGGSTRRRGEFNGESRGNVALNARAPDDCVVM